MAWDLQLDPETGDLVFNGSLDIAPVVGEAIVRQRMSNRIKIDYGSFIYERTLGSRLRGLLSSGVPRTDQNLRALITDALAPMDDITVVNVIVSSPDSHSFQASIIYLTNTNASPFSEPMTPEAQATILLPG